MNVILAFICFLLITAILFWKCRRYYYYGFKLPGPSGLQLLGKLLELKNNDFAAKYLQLKKYLDIFGPIARLWVGPLMIILVAGPDELAKVVENDKIGRRGIFVTNILQSLFKNGLLGIDNVNDWKIHRKIVTNALHINILNKFVQNFTKNSIILANRFKDLADGSNAHNILPYLGQCSFDIITQTCFAIHMDAQINNDLTPLQHNETLLNIAECRLSDPFLMFNRIFFLTNLGKKFKVSRNYFCDMIKNVINDRARKVKSDDEISKNPTLIDCLIQNGQFNSDDIIGEIITIGGAGSHTTAITSSFALALLAEYQDIQEKVLDEQRIIFGKDFLRPVTSEDVHNMTYLEQVINETLRMFPPVFCIPRETIKQYDIGKGNIVPAGAQLMICIHLLHRNPEYYPDPDRFDPDRFTPDNVAARHPYAFIPFGIGRRMCVGYKFAHMEMKTILSTVLRYYHILEVKGGIRSIEDELNGVTLLRVKNGIQLKFKPRELSNME